MGILYPILAGISSFAGLMDSVRIHQLWYSPGNIDGLWQNLFFLLCAVVFAASPAFLICELLGYTKLKFTVTVASASVFAWILISCRSYYRAMNASASIPYWLCGSAPFWLIAFAVVFLFGKFVLFKKPNEEQTE